MAKSKTTPAGRADRMVQAAFTAVASQRIPDHIVQLADDLETARRLGRLRKPDRAA